MFFCSSTSLWLQQKEGSLHPFLSRNLFLCYGVLRETRASGCCCFKIHENWWALCSVQCLEDKLYFMLTQTANIHADMRFLLRGNWEEKGSFHTQSSNWRDYSGSGVQTATVVLWRSAELRPERRVCSFLSLLLFPPFISLLFIIRLCIYLLVVSGSASKEGDSWRFNGYKQGGLAGFYKQPGRALLLGEEWCSLD